MIRLRFVRKAAVLGAGVMGAQIAAHLANADVEVTLFELAAEGNDPNANVTKALAQMAKLEPAPAAVPERLKLVRAANYDEHLDALRDCDLVIEAIAERADLKSGLYARIAPFLSERAVLCTNTSGIGIDRLAKTLPEHLRRRFCGMHFFNPPRYMPLVELVPGSATDSRLLDDLETFLTTGLGKRVLRAKDTPNFIANRIGVFSMVATMHHAQRLGLAPDVVDALTGPALGRAKSATYRTADVVGLDTLRHVVEGSAAVLQDDPWVDHLKLPEWMSRLIDAGALGQKTRQGVFKKTGKTIEVVDPASGQYRPAEGQVDPSVAALLKERDPAKRFAALRAADHPQAQFLWAIHRDLFHYCAHWLAQIADNARDLDLAIRWGFGWSQGPFEIWQAAGWREIAKAIGEDIAAGKTLVDAPLAEWVGTIDAVHTPKGSYAPLDGAYRGRSTLPVYRRQPYPDRLVGEVPASFGETALETDAVRLWHEGDGIAVLSFKSKMHAIGDDVLQGTLQALELAERDFDAVVLWHGEAPFSAGANLAKIAPALAGGDFDTFERMVALFQETTQRLRHASVPVVAAAEGLALGGGCEFLMHCDHVVAALESYVGLVEVGVGLIPAGGGCKELAARADAESRGGDLMPFIQRYFQTIATAQVAKSAEQAQAFGLLRSSDQVLMHPLELLHVAKAKARGLAESGYRPPLDRPVRVAGTAGIASLRAMLVNMRAGGFISAHDERIATELATVLCGGEVDPGSEVSTRWLLDLERAAFVRLARSGETQARIEHMLKTGKPLRN